MEQIRLICFPDCKMVTSGAGMFGDPHFDRVEKLIKREEGRSPYPQNFLADAKNGGLEWLVLYREGMDTSGLDIVDFRGGVYAVVCGIDAQSNEEEMQAVQRFLTLHGLMRDSSRRELGNVIGNERTKALLGYDQMDYYIPVKQKEK